MSEASTSKFNKMYSEKLVTGRENKTFFVVTNWEHTQIEDENKINTRPS